MDAAIELSGERGYEGMLVSEVVRRAAVARKTLYESFSGKEELFMAALDDAFTEGLGRAEAACAAAGEDWRRGVEAGLGAVLDWVAARPGAARACLVESLRATPASARRYDAALLGFAALLRGATPAAAGRSRRTEEALVAGIAWVLNRQVRRGRAEQVPRLRADLARFLLLPYSGVEDS